MAAMGFYWEGLYPFLPHEPSRLRCYHYHYHYTFLPSFLFPFCYLLLLVTTSFLWGLRYGAYLGDRIAWHGVLADVLVLGWGFGDSDQGENANVFGFSERR